MVAPSLGRLVIYTRKIDEMATFLRGTSGLL